MVLSVDVCGCRYINLILVDRHFGKFAQLGSASLLPLLFDLHYHHRHIIIIDAIDTHKAIDRRDNPIEGSLGI